MMRRGVGNNGRETTPAAISTTPAAISTTPVRELRGSTNAKMAPAPAQAAAADRLH